MPCTCLSLDLWGSVKPFPWSWPTSWKCEKKCFRKHHWEWFPLGFKRLECLFHLLRSSRDGERGLKPENTTVNISTWSRALSTLLTEVRLRPSELCRNCFLIVKSYENLSNFGFLPSTIQSLERSGAKLVEQIAVVKTVVDNVDGFPGNTGKEVKEKLGKVLGKNMGYSILCSILDLLNR